MAGGHCPYLVKRTNLIALVGGIRQPVADVEDSHNVSWLVGAAGFEPTTSLEFKSGRSNR